MACTSSVLGTMFMQAMSGRSGKSMIGAQIYLDMYDYETLTRLITKSKKQKWRKITDGWEQTKDDTVD
jgi:hypothetical protein